MSFGDRCLTGRCYYCARTLICAVALPREKRKAMYDNLLTCGPCVHVHGRMRWRPNHLHQIRRWRSRRIMRAKAAAAAIRDSG